MDEHTYKPGDWVEYHGTRHRYCGWHFVVASVDGEWLRLQEPEQIWGIQIRCRATSVKPCFP